MGEKRKRSEAGGCWQDVDERPLEFLLGQVAQDDFLATTWEQKLLVSQGHDSRSEAFGALFTAASFFNLASEHAGSAMTHNTWTFSVFHVVGSAPFASSAC